MNLETLLTLAVTGLILVLALILRLLVVGMIRLVRVVTGRPALAERRSISDAVAKRSWNERMARVGGGFRWVGRGLKSVLDAVVALLAVIAAGFATGAAHLIERRSVSDGRSEAESDMQLV
ncbi:MAG TPA: hypothetical protein VNP73_02480 [Actinomycetota bacterium]|nr:hypothetical protein [Actinomycetota bacterium]